MIVVDTNVVAYLWIPGDQTQLSEKLLVRDRSWVAPTLLRSELRNVLVTNMRAGRLTLESGTRIAREVDAQFRNNLFAVGDDDVLRVAMESGCTGYDAEFAALALELEVPFVTTDKRLLKALPNVACSLESMALDAGKS